MPLLQWTWQSKRFRGLPGAPLNYFSCLDLIRSTKWVLADFVFPFQVPAIFRCRGSYVCKWVFILESMHFCVVVSDFAFKIIMMI